MRVIVFFDLPVSTKTKRKEYAKFRKNLINTGFSMLQFSVYVRTVRNNDDAQKYVRRIKTFVPPEGSVRIMVVTEKQFDSMEIVVGEKTKEENYLDTKDIIEL